MNTAAHAIDASRIETTKASDLFVRALEAEGVEYIFAVPGEENLDLVESVIPLCAGWNAGHGPSDSWPS